MKTVHLVSVLVNALSLTIASTALAQPVPVTTPVPVAAPTGHPLKGVIVDIVAEKKALLVKHEEIPGVMRAMTMLLKVDAPTLASAQKGQVITATLLKKSDGWWLENITPLAPTP